MLIKLYLAAQLTMPFSDAANDETANINELSKPGDYRLSWSGDAARLDLFPESDAEALDLLEEIFAAFNLGQRPAGFADRSLSIGDVVMLDDAAYQCRTIGWQRLDDWKQPDTFEPSENSPENIPG